MLRACAARGASSLCVRHRLRRVCYVGVGHRPRGVQARGWPADEWEARSPSDFWAHSVGRLGARSLASRRAAERRVGRERRR
eukprot:6555037-Prymnesium_polylepis.1